MFIIYNFFDTMRYTGPKMKLCRREQNNLFGSSKYNLKKRRTIPGQHGSSMQRYSEYGKLLRNKQMWKRTYQLTEKQFSRIVLGFAEKYSRNKGVTHDVAVFQFLETRLDSVIYRSGLAQTIMQARQMVTHGHLLLNGKKHNIPSTFVKVGDEITVKKSLQTSPLYSQAWSDKGIRVPSWIKVDKKNYAVELLDLPKTGEVATNGDLLKVIEFYARA